MKATAYYCSGAHTRDVPLEEGMVEAFRATFGPHQSLADELRETYNAERVVVHDSGRIVAESEE